MINALPAVIVYIKDCAFNFLCIYFYSYKFIILNIIHFSILFFSPIIVPCKTQVLKKGYCELCEEHYEHLDQVSFSYLLFKQNCLLITLSDFRLITLFYEHKLYKNICYDSFKLKDQIIMFSG